MGDHLNFPPKVYDSFSVFFCLVEEELIYQLDLRKYIENQNFYSTSQKTKNKIKGAKIYSNFIIITFKTPEKNPLIAAGFFALFTTFAQTLIKFLKTKICVKMFIFFLLLRENQTFTKAMLQRLPLC